MKSLTLSTALFGSLCLGALVLPAYSKDDQVKDKLQAIQQRMQQNQQQGGGKQSKPGNNDFGRQIQQVQKQNLNQNQPKLFNPPANNNNQNNDFKQRLEQLQQQQKQKPFNVPKVEQPKFEPPKLPTIQPGNTNNNPFNQPGKNPFNPPGGNQDLKNKLESLKPKDGKPPTQPGNNPFNPGNNQDLKNKLESLKPKDGVKPLQPGNNPFNQPGVNQDLKNKLESLKPKDGTKPGIPNLQPQTGNNPFNPGNNQDLKNKLDSLKPKDGTVGGVKPILPGKNPLGDKAPDLSTHFQNELNKNPKLKAQLEALKHPKVDGGNKDLKDVLGGGRVANPNGKPGPLPTDTIIGKFNPKVDLQKGAVPIKIDRDKLLESIKKHQDQPDGPKIPIDLSKHKGPRNEQELQSMFLKLKDDPQFKRSDKFAGVDLDRVSGQFQHRLGRGDIDFNRFVDHRVQKNLLIDTQFALYRKGDVARQLNLNINLINAGGWRARPVGPVFNRYTNFAYSAWYPGPAWCPHYCWTPHWSPWVSWSFWNWCVPVYDPRPFICRPIIYDPCPPVVVYEYPVWQPLQVVTCGTWIDVPPVVIDTGFDLELLAVRFVDPGHQEQNLGPRYRVWVRNNSPAAIGAPFNVTLVAANGPQLLGELPQAGATIPNLDPNSVMPIDIRLPLVANRLGRQADGTIVPFSHLHVMVDSHRDLAENNEANNGTIIDRTAIYPVDPAGFSTDVTAAAAGAMVSLAGEGFGPEPGQLLVTVNGQTQQAEIHGWYDLGINFKMPDFNLSQAADAQLIVVRGDSAVSNPVELDVAPQGWLQEAQLPPAPMPDGGLAVPPAP